MLTWLKNIFKKSDGKLIFGATYGVLHGQFVGELFVYIESTEKSLHFLSIPNMKTREVPKDKYEYAIQNRVIEYVERLPRNERNMCKAQYIANKQS